MTKRTEPHRQCLQTALRILTRRDHSIHELEQKLKHKGHQAAAIKTIIADCVRLGYLNDDKAAHQFVLGFKRQGYGPLRIKQKLKAKGIAEDLINKALEQNLDTEEQIQICRRVLVKRIKTSSVGLERPQMREKMYRFLFNRGFAADTIQQVIAAQAEQT